MYVKPAPGLRVIDPVRKQFMPDDGQEISDTDLYWARRLRDGDVVRIKALASPIAPALPAVTDKGSK